jgi:predicted glycosyltransferase
MLAWLDIDNPPQVQYLLPLREAFEDAGLDVVVTARDYGMTYALLESRGVPFVAVGSSAGAGKIQKLSAMANRAQALRSALRPYGRPAVLVSPSRAAAIAARRLGTASFVITDYEYADTTIFRLTGSHLLFPDAIDAETFRRQGLRAARLVPFAGVKEDLSFAGLDIDAVEAWAPAPEAQDGVRVLFRPPAEQSHYYRSASLDLSLELLRYLASHDDVQLVYSARHPWQREYLRRFDWAREPIVLDRPVPFVSLLKGVDAVISAGGTMLREAAYLGIPAYSIFQSEIGGVDRQFERTGRMICISSPVEFGAVRIERRHGGFSVERREGLPGQLVQLMLTLAGAEPRTSSPPTRAGPRRRPRGLTVP